MRHDEHRDVLRTVPVSVTTSFGATTALAAPTSSASCAAIPTSAVAVAAAACRDDAVTASSCAALTAAALSVSASAFSVSVSVAECDTTASSGGSECDTASSSACGAECDGVASSAAARDSVAADHAFRLVLDASPDGLPVLVGQRLPRCEQQRVLPSGRVEPRLLWREQPERAHVCGLLDASNN